MSNILVTRANIQTNGTRCVRRFLLMMVVAHRSDHRRPSLDSTKKQPIHSIISMRETVVVVVGGGGVCVCERERNKRVC